MHRTPGDPFCTHRHLVQLYGADGAEWNDNVAHFLQEALESGNCTVVIAEAGRAATLARTLRGPSQGRQIFCDADAMLMQFMLHGRPDPALFNEVVGRVVQDAVAPGTGVCAYGEMVGRLWQAGNTAGAIELERLWNGLMGKRPITLICGYPIDVFGPNFTISAIDPILREHTCLLPAIQNGSLEEALDRAMSEILGPRADSLRPSIKGNFRPSWADVPSGETTILWIRNNLPDQAGQILARTRELLAAEAVGAVSA